MTDLDNVVDGSVTWQWARSAAAEGAFAPITRSTNAAYTPVEGDDGMYLQATASYTDGEGSGKSETSEALGPVVTYSPPAFSAAAATTIEVAEDTVAGENLGDPYTATDDDGDTPVYALSGTDAASFTIDSGTGQLMTSAALDYENKMTYMVTVEVRDNEDAAAAADTMVDDTVEVTVTVTNVEEAGTVTLSAETLVGVVITASVSDPDNVVDGSVTWQWASSAVAEGPFVPITSATNAAYTPVEGDDGMYLQATASYTDGEGSGKSAEAVSANKVVAATTAPTTGSEVGDTYDTNNDGEIGGPEVIEAVRDYFAQNITGSEVIEVVRLYFVSR